MLTRRSVKHLPSKRVIGILGVVLLGAVANGVWEHMLEPVLTGARDAVLNLASLWVRSFADNTYRAVAEGSVEAAGRRTLELISYAIALLVPLAIYSDYRRTRDTLRKHEKNKRRVDELISRLDEGPSEVDPIAADPRQELLAMRDELAGLPVRGLRNSTYAYIAILLFYGGFLIVQNVRTEYVASAAAHFEQLYAIAAPALDEAEEEAIRSRFYQIDGREDYARIIGELRAVATRNKFRVPSFSVW